MSKLKMVLWDDVLTIRNGRNQRAVEDINGKYPIYGSGGIIGYANDYLCEEDTVIIGRKGNINNPMYVCEKFWNVDTAFGLVANSNKLFPKYLYYFCLQYDFERLNTTVTIPSLTKSKLLEVEMLLPPLESQREIAKTLDTVSEILSMRKQQLVELDNLIKSIFYDMFGDPVTNEKGWKTRKLGALAVVKSGGTPSRSYLEFFRGDIPWITTVALGKTFIDESDAIEYITEEAINHSATKLINANSILFGIRVGVGKTAINRVPMCTNQDIVAIEDIDSELLNQSYLINTLNSFSKYFSQQQRGATIKGITSGTLKSIEIPIPPIESQFKFAQVVTLVENQKEQVITAVDESQYLFDSLMSLYFD